MNMPVFCAWIAPIFEYLMYYLPRVVLLALVGGLFAHAVYKLMGW